MKRRGATPQKAYVCYGSAIMVSVFSVALGTKTVHLVRSRSSPPGTNRPCRRFRRRLPGGFDRITWNPNQMNGQPCIRGMRLTVRRVLEAVALYPNRDDLFRNYPELEPDDIQQALAFAAANPEDSAAESNAA